MSKKPTRPKAKKPSAKTIIVFGLDRDRKPHAARFIGENEAPFARVAAAMGLRLAVPVTGKAPRNHRQTTGRSNSRHR